LVFGLALAGIAGACGGGADVTSGEGSGGDGNGSGASNGSGGDFNPGGAGEGNGGGNAPVLSGLRIEPEDAVLTVAPGEKATRKFRVFGITQGGEVDVTSRSVFYVPDNYLVGGFPLDGGNTFSTRLPIEANDPPQRGGVVTVRAQAANPNNEIVEITTSLTVVLTGSVLPEAGSPWASPALPANPGSHFAGTPDATRAPVLYYPNDGALLPPNLGQLEVHFRKGHASNQLFQVAFESATSKLEYYTRCAAEAEDFVTDSCVLRLTGAAFDYLATSNQGAGPVALRVRGSDEDGMFGESAEFTIEFAEQRVDGAVYYWNAKAPESIVRFDFGSGVGTPETFMAPGDVPGNSRCVGCHALSRQGDRMMFSLGNSSNGYPVYLADLSKERTATDYFALDGTPQNSSNANRILLGSFSPDGSEYVAVAPVNDAAPETRLFFHDGSTGARASFVDLPFVVGSPDWSPVGDKIAVTRITGTNWTTIEFRGGGISMVQRTGGTWQTAADDIVHVVPPEAGKNRFNPVFTPDGTLLLYSEVDQSSYSGGPATACSSGARAYCDGYSDPGSKTWAVRAQANATPVFLAKAAQGGVADGEFSPPQANVSSSDLMDTFPKPTPFVAEHRGKRLLWFTVSSQRRAGLRTFYPNASAVGDPATQALLWMFAIDPDRVEDGEDGSYPGFFLPFQDMKTSNHMAQWTERIVDADPPPPPPSVPPPPPPPPVPPVR
jgi:hypothetical protein